MDWSSLIGLMLALVGIVIGQILEGGHVGSLMQPAAFVIVISGTIGAVLLQSKIPFFLRSIKMLRWIVFPPLDNRRLLAHDINVWSVTARREGFLSLESHMESTRDSFVSKGLRLIIDGVEPTKLREILEADISLYEVQERHAVKIWEAAGGYAPTIGILGAVLGLIHVMENLSDPSKLGSGIAVAFVSTIYGVGLANIVFIPISNKLKFIVGQEVSRREILADVFFDIAIGGNARVIEERVAGYLR